MYVQPRMWRSAGRGLAGVVGALTVYQHPAFADTISVSHAVTASASTDRHNNHTWSTAPPADTNSSTGTTDKPADAPKQPSSDSSRRKLPKKLEQGTHFAVYDGKTGTASSLSSITAAIQSADVVFLGEIHDDPVAHILQLELLNRTARQLGYKPTGRSSNTTSSEYSSLVSKSDQQQRKVVAQPARPLILSLEMFERDVQSVVDEYLQGYIPLRDLLRDSRPWPNYITDYAPLVDYCKSQGIPVIAANAPRRYVSLAGRAGRDALAMLPAAAKGFIAPLPYGQPSQRYVDKIQSGMRQAAEEMRRARQQQQQQQGLENAGIAQKTHVQQQNADSSTSGTDTDAAQAMHDQGSVAAAAKTPVPAAADGSSGACPYIGFNLSSDFLDAQLLWDATMAHSIAQQLTPTTSLTAAADSQPQQQSSLPAAAADARPLVFHVCGKFHCEEGLGIPEHLSEYAPGARMLTVVFVPSSNLSVQQQQQQQLRQDSTSAETTDAFEQCGVVVKGLADYVVLTDASLPRSFDSVHPV